jgi:hypothetical protein
MIFGKIIAIDNVVRETDELRIGTADEYDIDEYEVIEFYDWQSETRIRTALMEMINLLIDKVYYAIIKRYMTLYSMLKKYCKRATQFSRSNRRILKFSKASSKARAEFVLQISFLKAINCLVPLCLIVKIDEVRTNDILENINSN